MSHQIAFKEVEDLKTKSKTSWVCVEPFGCFTKPGTTIQQST